eukprot:jgi/Hompol1/2110/HPOL_005851-RA
MLGVNAVDSAVTSPTVSPNNTASTVSSDLPPHADAADSILQTSPVAQVALDKHVEATDTTDTTEATYTTAADIAAIADGEARGDANDDIDVDADADAEPANSSLLSDSTSNAVVPQSDKELAEKEVLRKKAASFLSYIEAYFARIQQCWYKHQALLIENEAETVRLGTHPNLIGQLNDIESKHKERTGAITGQKRLLEQRAQIEYEVIVRQAQEELQTKRTALRRRMLDNVKQKRWRLEAERSMLVAEKPERLAPPLEVLFKRRKVSKDDINEWSRIIQDPHRSYFPSCSVNGLTHMEMDDDFSAMGINIPAKLEQPKQLIQSPAQQVVIDMDDEPLAHATPHIEQAHSPDHPHAHYSAHQAQPDNVSSGEAFDHNAQPQYHLPPIAPMTVPVHIAPHASIAPVHTEPAYESRIHPDYYYANHPAIHQPVFPQPPPTAQPHIYPAAPQTGHMPQSASLPVGPASAVAGHVATDLYDNDTRFTVTIISIGEADLMVQRTDGSKTRLPLVYLSDGRVRLLPRS